MKKMLFLVILLMVFAVPAQAVDWLAGYGNTKVIEAYSYNNITTATNTQVLATAGVLAGIDVNGGTMGAITIYDAASCAGTTIATIASPYAGQVIPFGVYASTGICITTAAATNLTVIYK